MRGILRLALVAAMAGGAVIALGVAPASAHEERTVGSYHVAVGFGSEPAYAGQENSVQMFLHDAHDNPVVDLGDTLRVTVRYQGLSMPPLTMQPFFEVGESGIPGDYRAFFFPTRTGTYAFHFTGSIKGQNVDETFTSGPTTFSDVVDASTVEFPARDPTIGQIADRLDREIPRVASAAQAQATAARDRANSARTIGLVGLIVGALGLAAGVSGLVVARRRRPAT